MDTLEPLNIIDDRTPEQQMTGGDWDESQKLTRLDTSEPCQIFVGSLARWCGQRAHWKVNNTPVCDYDIQALAGMNSDNEAFFAPALWERERRRLFFSLMRRPEMRLVRLALRSINWCAGLDWTGIKEVQIDPPHDLKSCWSLDTDEYFVQCLSPRINNLTYDDFTLWYRCTGEPGCPCYFCSYPKSVLSEQQAVQGETAQFDDGFFFHATNAEGKRIV